MQRRRRRRRFPGCLTTDHHGKPGRVAVVGDGAQVAQDVTEGTRNEQTPAHLTVPDEPDSPPACLKPAWACWMTRDRTVVPVRDKEAAGSNQVTRTSVCAGKGPASELGDRLSCYQYSRGARAMCKGRTLTAFAPSHSCAAPPDGAPPHEREWTWSGSLSLLIVSRPGDTAIRPPSRVSALSPRAGPSRAAPPTAA